MHDKSLFFVALIPPQPLKNQISELKNQFADSYGSRHALKSPPHLTMIPPFVVKEFTYHLIVNKLEDIVRSAASFHLRIDGFGAFKPRVIYLHVKDNESLNTLHKELHAQLGSIADLGLKPGKPFSPHITLAFRDLSKKMFFTAWKTYKSKTYQAEFEVKSLFILKHNGKFWDIKEEMLFTGSWLP